MSLNWGPCLALGMMDHKTLLANVTEADIMHWKLYCNLQQWAICDQVTREGLILRSDPYTLRYMDFEET